MEKFCAIEEVFLDKKPERFGRFIAQAGMFCLDKTLAVKHLRLVDKPYPDLSSY